jgi:hypothetical protein
MPWPTATIRLVVGLALAGIGLAGRSGRSQDPLPQVGGVTLGDSAVAVERALGAPDRREESLGLVFWAYDGRGIELVWDRDRAVLATIVLRKPGAGTVQGVRVGDAVTVVDARWGSATRVRQEARFRDYVRSRWVQTVEVRDGHVAEITLAGRETP